MEQICAARTVQSGERRLYRIRPNLREGLDDAQCPGLDNELRLQEEFMAVRPSAYQPEMTRNVKKRASPPPSDAPPAKHHRPYLARSSATPRRELALSDSSPAHQPEDTPVSTGRLAAPSSLPSTFTPSPQFPTTHLAESPESTQPTYPYGPDTPVSPMQTPLRSVRNPMGDSELSQAFNMVPVQRPPPSPSRPHVLPHHVLGPQTPSVQTVPILVPPPPPEVVPSRESPAPSLPQPPDEKTTSGQDPTDPVTPSEATAKNKPWPHGRTMLEVDDGFRRMKTLMEAEPGLKQPHAFARVFGVEYKKSTVHSHQRAWREHAPLAATWREEARRGAPHTWSEFMRAVAALEKEKRDAGAVSVAGKGAGAHGERGFVEVQAQVQAFASPQGGVMMAVPPALAMPPQGMGAMQTSGGGGMRGQRRNGHGHALGLGRPLEGVQGSFIHGEWIGLVL